MAATTESRRAKETVMRCAVCRHLESEHGMTGTRPCLATVGPLLSRDFCPCDRFQAGQPMKMPTGQKPAEDIAPAATVRKPAA